MIVLGVDTAIRKTGYAVIDFHTGGSFKILDCGIIKNAATLPHSQCLRRLAGGMRELVKLYHPEAASIETAFAALASLDISKIPDDATDALALAFCHASLVVRNNSTCRVPSPI